VRGNHTNDSPTLCIKNVWYRVIYMCNNSNNNNNNNNNNCVTDIIIEINNIVS
jgi:hypothetical protein